MSESKNIFGKGRHTLIRGNSSSSENVSYRKIRFIRILGLGLGLCLLSLSFLLVSVHANPIIRITPKTLTNSTYSLGFSTYFGGTGWDQGQSIAVDSANNSYITGWTASNSAFPLKNAYQTTFGKGGTDAFVAKFDPTGNLVFSTYLGGNGNDKGYAIAVDSVGNSYVTGITNSNDFPLKNAYNKTYGGAFSSLGGDVFVAKFDPAGALVFSTYLGGSGDDYGVGIAVDSANNSYITGHTDSSTFPMKNAYNKTYGGGIDAFVAKFNATGSLVFSTFLGGSNSDFGTSIAVDNAGNSYVVGGTVSGNFPMMNAYQPTYGGAGPYNQGDAFIAKFNATGNGLVFSTYLGGSGDDVGCGIAVDSAGNSTITGYTASGNFPMMNAYNNAYSGGVDVFVTRLNATGNGLVFSTYLGESMSGGNPTGGCGIAVDSVGNSYIVGGTAFSNFPTTMDAYQRIFGGGQGPARFDVFVSRFDTNGNLVYSTFLGGNDVDSGDGIAVDSTGNNIYITGTTFSTNFPIINSYSGTNSGGYDGYVSEFTTVPIIPPPPIQTKPQIPSPETSSELLQNPLVDIGIGLFFLSIIANIIMILALRRK